MICGIDCRFRRGLALELSYAKACNDEWSILTALGMPITDFSGNAVDFKGRVVDRASRAVDRERLVACNP
jgi:hypothetical protein